MKEPDAYKGREQTYLKHFFLERYLERVAFNIGWANPDFVYVDGFSGPWRSEDEEFEDTSFMIAINRLRRVRDALAERGRTPRIRCIFVESDTTAFAELEKAVADITDIDVRPLRGEFEEVLPQIIGEVGQSFALTFIDPTGWTGFALQTISPLLKKRGEVLINFMFDYINRFRADGREATAETFNELFGGPGWEESVSAGEEAMQDFYQERLKEFCGFTYATRTRILKPLSDRTYFHLVYATRHPKGLIELRSVEKQLLKEQEHIRADARQTARVQKSGQEELFRDADAATRSLEEEQAKSRARAKEILLELLDERSPRNYEEALPAVLEVPMVDEPAAKRLIKALHNEGRLVIEGMKPKQRLPKKGCVLIRPSRGEGACK